MSVLPIATFLAGSLLTLLLPVSLLVALVIWYMLFLRRVPESDKMDNPGPPESTPGATTTASTPSGEGS